MSLLALGAASLWLGILLGATAFAVIRLWPRLGSVGRYRVWYATLLLTFTGPVLALVPWRAERTMAPPPASGAREAAVEATPVDLPSTTDLAAPGPEEASAASWGWRVTVPGRVVDAAFWVWVAGTVLMLGRLAMDARRLARLRRRAAPPPRELLRLWGEAVQSVPTGRRLRLLVSGRVQVPMACGWLRPAVIVPEGIERDFAPDEVRQLLMHELAHLARWDDWHLLVQQLVRALCWWHPVVRWVTERLETEREFACDAMVAAHADRRGYARTLVRVAAATLERSSPLAPTALRGRLTERVERLMGRASERGWEGWRRAGSGLVVSAMAVSWVWVGPPAIAAPSPPAPMISEPPEVPSDTRQADAARARGAVAQALDSVLRAYTDSGFSGTVLVAMGDDVVLERGYGLADRERGIPATANTRYSTAGITKLFTAAAVLLLEHEGRLAVTDRLSRWVGPLPGEKDDVTLHHLLTHTDGLTRLNAPVYRRSAEAFVEAVRQAPAAFAPGRGYRYNDFGHSLLGLVVERASGDSYESFVRRRLLKPAGLKHTGFEPDGIELAVEYAGRRADQPVGPRAYTWGRRGSLGLVSTAGDLFRWYRGMRGGVLPEKVWDRMTVAHAASDWGAAQGYGWDLQPRPGGHTLLRRVAGTPGFEGEILHDATGRWTAVILVNSRLGWRFKVWQAIERAVRLSDLNR